jgi:hypothetical protein
MTQLPIGDIGDEVASGARVVAKGSCQSRLLRQV